MKAWSPKSSKLCKTICLAVFLVSFTSQAAVTLTASQDNNTFGNDPDAPQGSAGASTTIQAKKFDDSYGRVIYLKFDLTGQNFTNNYQAVFNIFSSSAAASDTGMALYALKNGVAGYDWSETTLTWNNAPARGTGAGTTDGLLNSYASILGTFGIVNATAANTKYTVSFPYLTDYLQPDNTITLVFLARDTTNNFNFHSSEATTTYRPTLVFDVVPEPGRAMLLMLSMVTFLGRRRR